MRVWIDIDNPPQVQYLLPFKAAFEEAGAETVITARDYGSTVTLLERAGVEAHVFGSRVGRGKLRKVAGLAARSREFRRLFKDARPDALLAASRPSAVAARSLGTPSFIVGDYEYANVSVYRLTGSTLLHPDAIDPEIFRRRGLRERQLVSFRGLKEDITFAGVDVDAVEPHDLGEVAPGAVRVLFRPPSETSHYYNADSTSLALATLARLAGTGAQVVFSPREPEQRRYLDGLGWAHPPIVLERPAPFVALLKSVDAVVCSGGTMLREAAYLGIPAYSIFQSEIGGVDLRLEQLGRAVLLRDEADLERLELAPRGPLSRLDSNPDLLREIVALIAERAGAATGARLAPLVPS
jgi:predicted glycosyltransferase